jgi:hypothetical protein
MHTFLDHYGELLSDPAHTAVELTFTILVDGLVLGLLWPLVRRFIDRRLQRQHRLLDEEHGYVHEDGARSSAAAVPPGGGPTHLHGGQP